MRLPVGGDPLYSPRFLPEQRKRPTTVFPSATSSAISIRQSGKAERNVIKDRFMGLANSGVKSSSTTSRLPPFMASIRRRTMALFSADMILLPASWGAGEYTLAHSRSSDAGRYEVERLLIIGGLFVLAGLSRSVVGTSSGGGCGSTSPSCGRYSGGSPRRLWGCGRATAHLRVRAGVRSLRRHLHRAGVALGDHRRW